MFHSDNTISGLEQIFYPRNVESGKMVRRYKRLGNPDVSQPWHTTLPLGEYKNYSTQDMRRSSIASVTVRWTPIRLLHFLPLTKPQLVYESHYGLPLLLHLQLGRLLDLSLQVLSPQNPGSAGSQLLSVVHPE